MLIKRLDSGIHGGQWQDVLATIAGVALIGYIIALLPVRRNIR